MNSIATNRAAIRVHYHGINNSKTEIQAYTRLASGQRVTNASDDAAGLFIAGRMKAQITGLERAVHNTFDGVSLVNTAEANLNEIRNMVLRMREIAVQMANGVYVDNPDRDFAQIEIDQLMQQIDLIADNANFNGVKLLDGSMQNVGIQTGPSANERPSIFFKDNTTSGLGIGTVSVTTQANSKAAMVTLTTALTSISDELSRAGAYENRFDHTISVLEQTAKATKISRGRIMDADIAVESTRLSKSQVLSQANTAMLAQANQSMGQLLSLFN
jgi:flagellin